MVKPIFVPQSQAVSPKDIYRPTDNPNRMSVEAFASLREFVRARGFLQPVEVTPSDVGKTKLPYTIVDGDHRVRVALELGMPEISAVVVDADEAERIRDRIAMNKHRGQLDVVSVGRDLERLIKEFEFTPVEIEHTGFSNEETLELLEALRPKSGEDTLLDEVAVPPSELEEDRPKKWRLGVEFDSESDRARAKSKILEMAAGGSLATGILNLVESAEHHE